MVESARREFKDRLYEHFAHIGKAISAPKRLEILDILCQAERTVDVLAKEAAMTLANTSKHLQVLRAARLVEARREGNFVYYRLADELVCEFWFMLRELGAKRIAEIQQLVGTFFKSRDELEPINRDDLIERVKAGLAVVIDVRPKEEYLAGHIPGARSLPVDELESRLGELPSDVEIVAYCRGPYCVFSLEAVEILRSRGFSAVRFEDGVREWSGSGQPIAVGEEG
jgi:rhodanese-related sulfurtransferase